MIKKLQSFLLLAVLIPWSMLAPKRSAAKLVTEGLTVASDSSSDVDDEKLAFLAQVTCEKKRKLNTDKHDTSAILAGLATRAESEDEDCDTEDEPPLTAHFTQITSEKITQWAAKENTLLIIHPDFKLEELATATVAGASRLWRWMSITPKIISDLDSIKHRARNLPSLIFCYEAACAELWKKSPEIDDASLISVDMDVVCDRISDHMLIHASAAKVLQADMQKKKKAITKQEQAQARKAQRDFNKQQKKEQKAIKRQKQQQAELDARSKRAAEQLAVIALAEAVLAETDAAARIKIAREAEKKHATEGKAAVEQEKQLQREETGKMIAELNAQADVRAEARRAYTAAKKIIAAEEARVAAQKARAAWEERQEVFAQEKARVQAARMAFEDELARQAAEEERQAAEEEKKKQKDQERLAAQFELMRQEIAQRYLGTVHSLPRLLPDFELPSRVMRREPQEEFAHEQQRDAIFSTGVTDGQIDKHLNEQLIIITPSFNANTIDGQWAFIDLTPEIIVLLKSVNRFACEIGYQIRDIGDLIYIYRSACYTPLAEAIEAKALEDELSDELSIVLPTEKAVKEMMKMFQRWPQDRKINDRKRYDEKLLLIESIERQIQQQLDEQMAK